MNNIYEVQLTIEQMLNLKIHYNLDIIEIINIKNIKDPTNKCPNFNPSTNMITIGKSMHWNEVYQLSHELLHAAFNENIGCNLYNYRWFEEILCEAFSLYCLDIFCDDEFLYWCSYMSFDKYYNDNLCTKSDVLNENINSIQTLNIKLSGIKTFATLQFIQPTVIMLYSNIKDNFTQLLNILNYTIYINPDNTFIQVKNNIIKTLGIFLDENHLR